jgi:hypothetical protein
LLERRRTNDEHPLGAEVPRKELHGRDRPDGLADT